MAEFIEPLEELVEQFRRLEGIGRKTAVRLAFSVLNFTEEQAADFASAILNAKTNIHLCPVCQNISAGDLCPVCASSSRDTSTICVVEDPRAVMAIEKVKEYRGLYHVLHGAISPMKGIGPDRLKIKELMERLTDGTVKEVILATNPTVEGEATAMYISRLLRSQDIKVTRIANGVPVGGDLEYADEVTLFRALQGRIDI
ncbi:MAG: recombination protein RecR [Clostridia bacterium]|nr:recombination protein RecR [Clostridia bacterium]